MGVPNNEGKVCDAVVRALEKWTGATRADLRHPDKGGDGPPVDLRLRLGAQEYAIEHTRIEPFESSIRTDVVVDQVSRYVTKCIPEHFLGPAYYVLRFPNDISLPSKSKRARALNELMEWIRTSERILRDRNRDRFCPACSPYWETDSIRGIPPGFECEFELLYWPCAALLRRSPGALAFWFTPMDEWESPRRDSLRRALSRKCHKLQACKAAGARTVLVLESGDSALRHFEFRGDLLPSVLAQCGNAPDEIFLLETASDPWWVWLLKRDDCHWPETGMPELSAQYYDPNDSGIPAWPDSQPRKLRKALQMDVLYTPYLRGWAPIRVEKDNLHDLTARRG